MIKTGSLNCGKRDDVSNFVKELVTTDFAEEIKNKTLKQIQQVHFSGRDEGLNIGADLTIQF